MPRVSEAHLAARRQQILDAAVRCFVRNGFHQTSMQDVIKEADLSVGAFYRYFKSKNELIMAIAGIKIGEVTGILDNLLAADPMPPLPAFLDAVIGQVEATLQADQTVRIAIQIWGEATYDDEVAEVVRDVYRRIRERMVRTAERARATGQLPPGADATAVGAAIFGLVQGYILQRILVGQVDRETYVAGVRALMTPA
ncbi:TetR family transcriptional regulator [Actinoplanes sp. SE50]|uniref:TetR/AcrR family transcriptional regulator n=1 Tax=unclassified Actinoplanes TaxID=2626549 RepID=UPI00023ED058|nr:MULTISPECIES: TetR/AcrR family transcriptional regulator [unclassified Actinoplanes]AEV83862.1 HTH-type transcriptional regulator betI [Actinoplanes sp. SE50/110]ATO81994.1 TetR family transcriptional regulator [Actinoplanes sp. SE50]SLL99402.1 TetR family transcriptional regulator [Actinoplanes sp. SE50/110]